jgi:pilus assembly protein CpaE
MTTIVERDSALADMLQSAAGGGGIILESLDQLRRHLAAQQDEYAVVLGPSVELSAATALADTVRVTQPGLSIILLRRRIDTAVLADCLRAGVREVIEDRDLTGLGEAVRRAYTLWQALTNHADEPTERAQGQLITVFSAKGGVGKSTVATNLAASLVDEGKQRVCLVDLDLAFGDVALMLQQFPTHTIADAPGLDQVDPSAVQSLLTEHSDGLYTLAAPLQPDAKESIPAALVGRILQILKESFDFVVVDTAPAFDDFILQAFDHSDLILLVGTLDIPALKSLKLTCDTFELLNLPKQNWRLVLNRADSKVGLSPAEVEKTLGMSITTSIPSSRDVPACINRGVLIVRAEPRHGVSASIKDLAKDLLGSAPASVATSAVPAGERADQRRGGLLRRKSRAA